MLVEYAENEIRLNFNVSERVAILKALPKKKLGDNQHGGSQNFAILDEAAKKAGLGNKETARRAIYVIREGAPALIHEVDSGNMSTTSADFEVTVTRARIREFWGQMINSWLGSRNTRSF